MCTSVTRCVGEKNKNTVAPEAVPCRSDRRRCFCWRRWYRSWSDCQKWTRTRETVRLEPGNQHCCYRETDDTPLAHLQSATALGVDVAFYQTLKSYGWHVSTRWHIGQSTFCEYWPNVWESGCGVMACGAGVDNKRPGWEYPRQPMLILLSQSSCNDQFGVLRASCSREFIAITVLLRRPRNWSLSFVTIA